MRIYYLLVPVVVIGTALFGSYLTSLGLGEWYGSLNLPSFAPPGGLIGTVWSTIYLLVAICAFIFYARVKDKKQKDRVTAFFLVNAFLNVFWSFLFFANQLIGFAILDSILLGFSVLILIYLIYPVSKLAAGLLLPYVVWVGFATYLNYLIWTLN